MRNFGKTLIRPLWRKAWLRVERQLNLTQRVDAIEADTNRAVANQQLAAISARLESIENRLHGAHAVYLGNGRVLTRANFHNLIYVVEADDRLIAPHFIMNGVFEVDGTSFFLKSIRPDSRCVDVGANFGYYTCMMARLAHQGRTTGIEADPQTFELLRENVLVNWLHNVSVINVAASDVDGELTLYRRRGLSGNTSIGRIDDHVTPVPFTIGSKPLDELILEPVDFMKVDVEGAEPLVFRGARRLVSASSGLQIIMEWSPEQLMTAGFDPATFTHELAAMGLLPNAIGYDGTHVLCTWAEVRSKPYCNLLLQRARSPS